MNLPELPSDKELLNWLLGFKKKLIRYLHDIWCALRSPTSVIGYSVYNRSKGGTYGFINPLPFALVTLVFASLLATAADLIFGVNKPFFEHYSYYAQYKVFGHWIAILQKILPNFISASIVLYSIKFSLVILVVILWSRALSGNTRSYWADVAAFLYLLPFVLIAEISGHCAIHVAYRMIGDNALMLFGIMALINMFTALIIYGFLLKIVDQIFNTSSWRRFIHIAGYLIIVPVLTWTLNIALYAGPIGFHAYSVLRPMMKGDAKLDIGDYEAAETLYKQAIKNDITEGWSSHAHIRLVSSRARRILALLPNILGDAGIRKRLLRSFSKIDPFKQVANAFSSAANVSHERLIEFREAILRSFLMNNEIPVTDSELDCALKSTAEQNGCDELPKEMRSAKANNYVQRHRLYYIIYRTRALRGEPTTGDATRYLQFLLVLPIRIEMMFVRYHALNLSRESESLAFLDDRDRFAYLESASLKEMNRKIIDKGYKFPHLIMPDNEIAKMSDREFGFHMRQAYLNYLKAETQLLATSSFSSESSIIREEIALIEQQLEWISSNEMYTRLFP